MNVKTLKEKLQKCKLDDKVFLIQKQGTEIAEINTCGSYKHGKNNWVVVGQSTRNYAQLTVRRLLYSLKSKDEEALIVVPDGDGALLIQAVLEGETEKHKGVFLSLEAIREDS
jgi:hypothetical protein